MDDTEMFDSYAADALSPSDADMFRHRLAEDGRLRDGYAAYLSALSALSQPAGHFPHLPPLSPAFRSLSPGELRQLLKPRSQILPLSLSRMTNVGTHHGASSPLF